MQRPSCFIVIVPVLAVFGAGMGCDLTDSESGVGEVVWRYAVADPYEPKVQPAIDRGQVFVAADLHLRCFELETGDLCWESRKLDEDGRFGSSLVYQDEQLLYVDTGTRVTSFAKENGAIVWDTRIDELTVYSFTPMAVGRRYLFMGGLGVVVRLRKEDGREDLRIPLDQLRPDGVEQTAGTPTVSDDGLLYVPTQFREGGAREWSGRLLVYETETGDFRWGFSVPPKKVLLGQDSTEVSRAGQSAVFSEDVVVLAATSSIIALNRHTGRLQWEWYVDDGIADGISVGDGRVYAGSTNGRMYAVDLRTGELLWRLQAPGFIERVAFHNGRVYSCNTGSGMMYVVDAGTGEVIWRAFPPGYEMDSFDTYLSPVEVGEGYMIDVGPRHIYALKAE